MAPASKDSGVQCKVLPSGDYALGVEIDGVFVPMVQKDGDYIAGLVESGKSPEAKAASGEANGGEE